MKQSQRLIKNTAMLYIMTAAKIIFPFLTLPYLTRVLSMEGYAVVSYGKSIVQYLQLFVDFGFILSATKAIVGANGDTDKMSGIVFNTILSRLLLAGICVVIMLTLIPFIPLLKYNLVYILLAAIPVILSCFLTDYLFQGIEQMHEISIRFVVMKGISTALTFIFVKSDADILYIPILDILSSAIAVALVLVQLKKYKIHYVRPSIKIAFNQIKESFVYFASNMATTAFGALNTLLIGVFLPEAQIALWTVSLDIISAIQVMYSPIINGIYPEMVKTKSWSLLKRMMFIFMPLIFIGCILVYFLSDLALFIVGGAKYIEARYVLRMLIPVLIFSFPGMLYGWPGLGAIDRSSQTTLTTFVAAIVQVFGLLLLIFFGNFTLINIAILRGISEFCLFASRFGFCLKYRKEFQ